MTYASLMVPLDLGPTAADRVKLAVGLAARFDADLIGIAARQTTYTIHGNGRAVDPKLLDADEQATAEALRLARAIFDREAGFEPTVTWRSAIASPLRYIAKQARAADLVVLGRHGADDGDAGAFAVATASLLMGLGRPVLIAPPNIDRLALDCVVVAWKDTKEARRSVIDALPLLRRAGRVLVASIVADRELQAGSGDSARDVVDYLAKHRVDARAHTLPAEGDSVTDDLLRFVHHNQADLLVTGAYGHSRAREWMFGGVTRDLLQRMPVCCFMSH